MTGAHTYIVHTSCEEAIRQAMHFRAKGVNTWIETVISYLTLDKSYAERPNFEGAKYVMSPPLRDKHQQPYLWNALRGRTISTVATDHAPFDFKVQKEMGRPPHSGFTKIPNGIPSVENRVDLLYTYGVVGGKIDLHTFVDCASTQAARIFGLKGKKHQYMATDYNAFEGWEVKGRAHIVTVRGQIMARDGKFVGKLGGGKLLQRDATH
jgi:dihydropyrimidinase